MQDGRKAVWSISLCFCSIFSKFKVSSRPDCIFEIYQLWQSVGCIPIEAESLKIGQSSHKLYSNNTLNFKESTTMLNSCTKNVRKLIEGST